MTNVALIYRYVCLYACVRVCAYTYFCKIIINVFFTTAILKKGNNEFAEIIKELKPIRKEALLRCAVTWNSNSRNSHVAQVYEITNLIRIVLVFKKFRMQASLNTLNLLLLLLFLGSYKCLNNRDRDTGAADIRFIFHSRSYDSLY